MKLSINKLRNHDHRILVLGNHAFIIQSLLDFDYLSGKIRPSVAAILGNEDGYAKYFWGRAEILLPVHKNITSVKNHDSITWFLNLLSGRRALSSGLSLLDHLPNLMGGVFFAENVPERHALELYSRANRKDVLFIGPSSVGLLVPGFLKLGPIGGVTPDQIHESGITVSGNLAVLSASGGMTNELINIAAQNDFHLSFALSFGGDRFPLLTPEEAFLLAESDPETNTVLYYGELGGDDEYRLIELKKSGKFTKNVILHVAGTVSDLFPQSPQFGHAKAKAGKDMEKASTKRQALAQAGFTVSSNFTEFVKLVKSVE